jgi:toxin ParE1/3/4
MEQIVWSKLALKDLDHIYDFIALESPYYAQKTIEQFLIRVEVLTIYPQIGKDVNEYLKNNVKELIEGNYRIFYRVNKNSISIIRVHHSARRIKKRK